MSVRLRPRTRLIFWTCSTRILLRPRDFLNSLHLRPRPAAGVSFKAVWSCVSANVGYVVDPRLGGGAIRGVLAWSPKRHSGRALRYLRRRGGTFGNSPISVGHSIQTVFGEIANYQAVNGIRMTNLYVRKMVSQRQRPYCLLPGAASAIVYTSAAITECIVARLNLHPPLIGQIVAGKVPGRLQISDKNPVCSEIEVARFPSWNEDSALLKSVCCELVFDGSSP